MNKRWCEVTEVRLKFAASRGKAVCRNTYVPALSVDSAQDELSVGGGADEIGRLAAQMSLEKVPAGAEGESGGDMGNEEPSDGSAKGDTKEQEAFQVVVKPERTAALKDVHELAAALSKVPLFEGLTELQYVAPNGTWTELSPD